MESFSTILIIFTVLVGSVVGIGVIQKREQAKVKLRQQIAKYRYRANETANILENFANIPIGEEARRLLLQYIQLNLSAANTLDPNDAMIAKNLMSINQRIEKPQSNVDKQRLNIPSDFQQLGILIKHLSRLGKYLIRFKSIKAMNSTLVTPAVNKIMLLISEAKICAYIQQAKTALQSHNYVNAQRDFQIAQQMLDRFSDKNSRLEALENELKELVKATPQEAAKTELSIDSENQQAYENENEDENDNIFGPKKKW